MTGGGTTEGSTAIGRILVCDDHRLFADAWALLLRTKELGEVVVCSTGDECLQRLAREHVDVCVVDRGLGDWDGLELIRAIARQSSDVAVVMVSASTDPTLPRQAIDAGARGFASKELGLNHLCEILRRVAKGEQVVERGLSTRAGVFDVAGSITARERTVLERLVEGKDTADLARELDITYATARTHIQNLLTKLGVHSKLELVAFAVEHQIVPVPTHR
jgi:two-component system nitrate/nitrite response regulator NarL